MSPRERGKEEDIEGNRGWCRCRHRWMDDSLLRDGKEGRKKLTLTVNVHSSEILSLQRPDHYREIELQTPLERIQRERRLLVYKRGA